MAITAAQVKELREKTGVGMMQCKKALNEADGSVEKAIELLRKRGEAVAAKRADKDANEGCVFMADAENRTVLAELNCETDFVGAAEDFQSLGSDVLAALSSEDVKDIDDLLTKSAGTLTIADRVNEVVAKLGENIGVKRFVQYSTSATEAAATYSHMGGKIGVAVKVSFDGTPSDLDSLKAIIRDICMQVAATNPLAIREDELDQEYIAKEREIYREQGLAEGKPANIVERMIEGRVKKYLKEVCLQDQIFVKDNKKSIADVLKDTASDQGITDLKIVEFKRMAVGA